jgi:hypothetical protein
MQVGCYQPLQTQLWLLTVAMPKRLLPSMMRRTISRYLNAAAAVRSAAAAAEGRHELVAEGC